MILAAGAAHAQDADDPNHAAFQWSHAEDAPISEADAQTDWTLDAGLEQDAPEPEPTEAQLRANAWMVEGWPPPIDPAEHLIAAFQFRPLLLTGGHGRADRWARSVFAQDASQLTPLAAGSEMFGWELTDSLTFSGVGSRRVITERDRGIVFSAEAGIRLSPSAGFQLGYELLQASAGAGSGDLGAESLFARFQLRF